jgi:hypothetical protein
LHFHIALTEDEGVNRILVLQMAASGRA